MVIRKKKIICDKETIRKNTITIKNTTKIENSDFPNKLKLGSNIAVQSRIQIPKIRLANPSFLLPFRKLRMQGFHQYLLTTHT